MFSTYWDTEHLADADVWADYGDHAEDTWSDADEDARDTWTDVEADADTLTSAGWGTDEDYGYYGGEDAAMEGHLFGWDA